MKKTWNRYTVEDLVNNKSQNWISIEGRILNITTFLDEHPGGRRILEDYVGTEAGEVFREETLFHAHSATAEHMLDRYQIGVLEGSAADTNYDDVPIGQNASLVKIRSKVDTSKPMLWQLVRLGADYPLYVMNTSLHYMRIFDWDFFEKMSRWPWWYIFIFWVPVSLVSMGYALLHGVSWLAAPLFVLGYLLWGLIEYVLHRFIFHWQPGGKGGNWFNFFAHGAHHLVPTDASRLTFPPWFAGFVGYLIFSVYTKVFPIPFPYACALFTGSVVGYMMYDTLHYAFHHFTMEGPLWPRYIRELRTRHLNHHYKNHESNFGVTSDLFDRIFGTWKCLPMTHLDR